MVRGATGYSFNQEIKDSILFEYHDISNDNALPDLDIIVARDILSYITVQQQAGLVNDFFEKVKSHGLVFIGTNEQLPQSEWKPVARAPVSAFVKK
jgi:purine-binding chemotaxis protein CheW